MELSQFEEWIEEYIEENHRKNPEVVRTKVLENNGTVRVTLSSNTNLVGQHTREIEDKGFIISAVVMGSRRYFFRRPDN